MERTLPMILQWDESSDIGSDTLTGVGDADYKPPFALAAKLNKLTIKVDRPQLSPEDIKKLQAAMQEKAKSRLMMPRAGDTSRALACNVVDLDQRREFLT